jgi:hypothetical protein
MLIQEIDGFSRLGVRFYGTLEKIGEKEAPFLEVGEDFFIALPCRGDGESGEKIAGEAGERSFGRVEKLGVGVWGGSRDEKSLDVDGAEARGPFEALQAAIYVLGRGQLAAAVARQKRWNGHIQKW